MSIIKFTALISILLLSGCVAFRDGANPPITKWPMDNATKNKTIILEVSKDIFYDNQELNVYSVAFEGSLKQVVRAYEDSGLFSTVKFGSDSDLADIRAKVTITSKGEVATSLYFLSDITMYLIIPAHLREEVIIKTTYMDWAGNSLASFEKSEFVDHWRYLYLLPITPFYLPRLVMNDMEYDINRNTIIEAHTKGIF